MAVAGSGPYTEELGGLRRPLRLTNAEIERFEIQHGLGIFALFDQLMGRGPAPQARHVRDIIALGLVGGGMPDVKADQVIADLPPSDNLFLRGVAQRLVGVTFLPDLLTADDKKKGRRGGSPGRTPAAPPSSGAPAQE